MFTDRRALTASSYASMFFLGVGITIIGAAAKEIGLDPPQIGLLLASQHLGFIISVAFTGVLADVVAKPKLLCYGSVVLGFSFLTLFASPLFWINLVVMFCTGAGMGAYEGAADAMLLDLHEKNQSRQININHFFVTFGSAMIALYLIFLELNWRSSMTQSGIVVLLLAAFFLFARTPVRTAGVQRFRARMRGLKNKDVVVLLFAAAVMAVGLELGTIGFLTSYLTKNCGFSQMASKIGLVIFLAGIAAGRLGVGLAAQNHQVFRCILILFGLSALLFATLYSIDLGNLVYALIFLCGAATSALFPLIIFQAALISADAAGAIIGLLKLAIPAGGMMIFSVISVISETYPLQSALVAIPAAALMGLVVTLLCSRLMSRPGTARSGTSESGSGGPRPRACPRTVGPSAEPRASGRRGRRP